MKTSPSQLRSVRGSAALTTIIVVILLAAVAGGAWWYFTQRDASAPKAVSSVSPTTQTSNPGATEDAEAKAAAAAAAAAAVEGLSIDQLYREARSAMAEQRLVAPAGNNALEFYLAILDKDETNSGAADALRELFPFASGTVEQEINQGNLDEADRIIASLAKADPSNYTLTILRSKLDAKKKQIDQQAAEVAAAAAAPAPKPQVEATPTPAETAAAQAAAEQAATAAAAAAAPPPAPVKAAPRPAPAPAAPKGESRDVEVVTPSPPSYPRDAARDRAEGWVEVEFTVTAEGRVVGAKVTASEPPRTFDREAIRSIERTKFSARLENGVAVSATVRRRIEFKLGR